jgi:lysozyme
MDDGNSSEYIELATKTGAKIRVDETNGFVYAINRDGTSWIQMDQFGNVDVFSANNISMRAQRDFNIRADRNVNIEAGQNIFLKAAGDTVESTTSFTYDVNNLPDKRTIPLWKYVGEGQGTGGNIVMQALNDWHSTTKNNAFLTVTDNNLNIKVGTNYLLTTENGGQDIKSKMGIKTSTEAAYDLYAKGNMRMGTSGSVNLVGDDYISLCTNAALSLSSRENTSLVAQGDLNIDATSVSIDTAVKVQSLNANLIRANTTDTGEINSRTRSRDRRPIGNGAPGAPASPGAATPIAPQSTLSASTARHSEVKPLNEKLNILATWEDPESKFKRNAEDVFTTVSRYPTYEPCPEHTSFSSSAVSSTAPGLTQPDKTYEGSGGAGNNPAHAPVTAVAPGVNNNIVSGDPAQDNSPVRDFDTEAFACQIRKHEGFSQTVYPDSGGVSVGLGHLLRQNEMIQYPLGSVVPLSQINAWYQQDSTTAIKIAQTLCTSWNDLSSVRKRALADLAYNLGQPRLSKFVKFLDAMNKKNFNEAAKELRNSQWFTQVGKRGPNIITMIADSVDPNNCGK